jgi:hypothetical protein
MHKNNNWPCKVCGCQLHTYVATSLKASQPASQGLDSLSLGVHREAMVLIGQHI